MGEKYMAEFIGVGPQQRKILLILKSQNRSMTIRELAREIHGRECDPNTSEYRSVAQSLTVMKKKGIISGTAAEIQYSITELGNKI